MFTKKYILIVDTEGMSRKKPYNVGIVVYNRTEGIKAKVDFYLLDCINENHLLKKHEETQTAYLNNLTRCFTSDDKLIIRTTSGLAKEEIHEIIKKYDIKEVWAFNKNFDYIAFQMLFSDYFLNPLTYRLQWYDIQQAILYTRLLTKKYVKFCVANNELTKNGNISTTAQTIYRYLKDRNFNESHNALDDALKELEILTIAMKSGRFHYTTNKQPYKELEKFCKSFDPPLKPYD